MGRTRGSNHSRPDLLELAIAFNGESKNAWGQMRILERWVQKQPWRQPLPKTFRSPARINQSDLLVSLIRTEPRIQLTASYQDARGPATRNIDHHMFLPHEIFASLHATSHSDLLYESTQQVTLAPEVQFMYLTTNPNSQP